ncbi:MAG: hypothetical protein AAB049_06170 [Nitrospirota bacterium]
MAVQHEGLAAGNWHRRSLVDQLANVGSEVGRMRRWHGQDLPRCERAFLRALELLDLTIGDARWRGRRKELSRVRAFLCDAMLGGKEYGSTLDGLDRYFLAFAVAARARR